MRKQTRLIALLLVCVAPIVTAQNILFLHRGPVAYLSSADQDLLRDAFRKALNESADNETVEWSNPNTGHSGSIEVLDTHEDFDTTCRTVRISTQAGTREGRAVHRLCKADDGRWAFAPERRG